MFWEFPNKSDFKTRQSRLKKVPKCTNVCIICWDTCELLELPPKKTFRTAPCTFRSRVSLAQAARGPQIVTCGAKNALDTGHEESNIDTAWPKLDNG